MPRSIAPMRPRGTGTLSTRTSKTGIESWYAQWWITPTKKVSRKIGPKRQPGSKSGLTGTMANAALRKLMAETPAPAATATQGVTFAQASKTYRAHLKRQGRKKSTLAAVESCMRIWAIPYFGTTPLDRVTYRGIEGLIALMESKPLAPKSIHNYIGTVSALYTYGLRPRVEWAKINPCEGVDLPAVEESAEIRFLTAEEVDALIRAVPDGPYAELDRVLYRVAATTGLRQGELVALRVDDVDFTVQKVRVRRNYVLGEFDTPKSRRSSRAVPLTFEVAGVLANWIPPDAPEDALVFADPVMGGPLSNAAILRRMRRALKAAGMPSERVFHDLRHSFGTSCAKAGLPMRTIQEWMGHRDIQTTMRYADYSPSSHEVEMVERAFRREGAGEGERGKPKEIHANNPDE